MDETIHAAQVDKRAKGRETAHDTLDDFALVQVLPRFGFQPRVFFGQHSFTAGNDALFAAINFDDLQFHRLADKLADFVNIALCQMRCRHEGAHAVNGSQQAALNSFLAHRVHKFAALILCHEFIPQLTVDNVALRKDDIAFAVVDLNDLHFDGIAKLHILVHQFTAFDEAVGLETDIDANFVVRDLYDLALNGLSWAYPGDAVSNLVHKALFGLRLCFFFRCRRFFLRFRSILCLCCRLMCF